MNLRAPAAPPALRRGGPRVPPSPARPEPAARADASLRRWTATWAGIGLVIVAVTAVFLVLISNALVGINDNLARADRAVTDVEGHTRTLPGQIADVNASLAKIDASLAGLPADARGVSASLDDITSSLRSIDGSLSDSAPRLSAVAGDLTATSRLVGPLAVDLRDTSALLGGILASTGDIDRSLVAVLGGPRSGLGALDGSVREIEAYLQRTRGDLGDILAGLGTVNGHLDRICRSAAINALHGRQPC